MLNLILFVSTLYLASAAEFSAELRKIVLDYHNAHRSLVSPWSKNMRKMTYDIQLEKLALKWASRCEYEHPDATAHPEYRNTGQNLAVSMGRPQPAFVDSALDGWWNEFQGYNIENNSCSIDACGHYTQMAWAETTRVGCAWNSCPDMDPNRPKPIYFYVCQYAPPGNVIGYKPYEVGQSCSKCPKGTRCEDNLCVEGSTQASTTTPKPTNISGSSVPPPCGKADEVIRPSESEEKQIISIMDTLRSSVDPPAANMKKVNFDRDLSTYTMYMVKNCEFDIPYSMDPDLFNKVAMTVLEVPTAEFSYEKALEGWWKSRIGYNFEKNACNFGDNIFCLNYKAMAWHDVTKMGCSAARCGGTNYVVCLYYSLADFMDRPYTKGPSASQCPSSYEKKDKLCHEYISPEYRD